VLPAPIRAEATPITEPGTPRRAKGPPDLWLIQTLLDAGSITDAQGADRRGVDRGSARQAAVHRGHVTDEQVVAQLSERFDVGIADLSVRDSQVAALHPESVARKYQVVALGADDRCLGVATAAPRDRAVLRRTRMA